MIFLLHILFLNRRQNLLVFPCGFTCTLLIQTVQTNTQPRQPSTELMPRDDEAEPHHVQVIVPDSNLPTSSTNTSPVPINETSKSTGPWTNFIRSPGRLKTLLFLTARLLPSLSLLLSQVSILPSSQSPESAPPSPMSLLFLWPDLPLALAKSLSPMKPLLSSKYLHSLRALSLLPRNLTPITGARSQNMLCDEDDNITALLDWDVVNTQPQIVGWCLPPDWLAVDWYGSQRYTWPNRVIAPWRLRKLSKAVRSVSP